MFIRSKAAVAVIALVVGVAGSALVANAATDISGPQAATTTSTQAPTSTVPAPVAMPVASWSVLDRTDRIYDTRDSTMGAVFAGNPARFMDVTDDITPGVSHLLVKITTTGSQGGAGWLRLAGVQVADNGTWELVDGVEHSDVNYAEGIEPTATVIVPVSYLECAASTVTTAAPTSTTSGSTTTSEAPAPEVCAVIGFEAGGFVGSTEFFVDVLAEISANTPT